MMIETKNSFIIKGVIVPKRKPGQLNIYDPAIIKTIGTDLFFQLVGPKEPIPIPDLGFTEAEWDLMEAQLRNDH